MIVKSRSKVGLDAAEDLKSSFLLGFQKPAADLKLDSLAKLAHCPVRSF